MHSKNFKWTRTLISSSLRIQVICLSSETQPNVAVHHKWMPTLVSQDRKPPAATLKCDLHPQREYQFWECASYYWEGFAPWFTVVVIDFRVRAQYEYLAYSTNTPMGRYHMISRKVLVIVWERCIVTNLAICIFWQPLKLFLIVE